MSEKPPKVVYSSGAEELVEYPKKRAARIKQVKKTLDKKLEAEKKRKPLEEIQDEEVHTPDPWLEDAINSAIHKIEDLPVNEDGSIDVEFESSSSGEGYKEPKMRETKIQDAEFEPLTNETQRATVMPEVVAYRKEDEEIIPNQETKGAGSNFEWTDETEKEFQRYSRLKEQKAEKRRRRQQQAPEPEQVGEQIQEQEQVGPEMAGKQLQAPQENTPLQIEYSPTVIPDPEVVRQREEEAKKERIRNRLETNKRRNETKEAGIGTKTPEVIHLEGEKGREPNFFKRPWEQRSTAEKWAVAGMAGTGTVALAGGAVLAGGAAVGAIGSWLGVSQLVAPAATVATGGGLAVVAGIAGFWLQAAIVEGFITKTVLSFADEFFLKGGWKSVLGDIAGAVPFGGSVSGTLGKGGGGGDHKSPKKKAANDNHGHAANDNHAHGGGDHGHAAAGGHH